MSIAQYPLISDWITVSDGRLVVTSGKVDIGQRISTALAQIVHEELTVPHGLIDMAPVRTGRSPDEGITSGSNSVEQSGQALRCASASLREVLVSVAATRIGCLPKDLVLSDGTLQLPATNHRLSIVGLAGDVDLSCRIDPEVAFLEVRHETSPRPAMRGIAAMAEGSFTFVHDIDVPGMLHARVVRPPHAHARLEATADGAEARLASEGLRLIRDGSFLAVTGPQEWPVVKAARRLALSSRWDVGAGLPETQIFTRLNATGAVRIPVIDGTPTPGDIGDPLRDPVHSARYERPYQLHAALGPSAAMAVWQDDTLSITCHSQGIYPLRASIADSLGLDPESVDISHVPGSGCYGHNGADDAAFEAALIAMQIPRTPVLVKWTREDEHRWEPFAPAMAVDLAATVVDGKISAFSAEVFSDTHRGRPRPGPDRAGPSRLLANRYRADPISPAEAQPNMGHHAGMHRNLDPIYDFPVKRLVKNLVTGLPHRTSAMRCLGAAANIFALESFIDELARGNALDPFEFRRAHLSDARAVAVLDELRRLVAELPPRSQTGGRGIAYAQYKNQMTRVGICVDLEVSDRAEVRLTRATIVADAGRVVDIEGLKAQLEGGFIQAASWALCEEVRWDRDGIQSYDWDEYPVIRFDNIPVFDVKVLDRPREKSLGAGEASPGPTIAAIANAIHDATGLRLRRMPFTADAILRHASAQ